MDEQAAAATEPLLTRKELRQRDDGARALLESREQPPGQRPQPAPDRPAPGTPGPRVSAPAVTSPGVTGDDAGQLPYDWQMLPAAAQSARYTPLTVRHLSPFKRLFRILGRAVENFLGGLWRLIKLTVITVLSAAVLWTALGYLAPDFASKTNHLLASYGISAPSLNPLAPAYKGFKPPVTDSADKTAPPPGVEASNHRLGTPAPFSGTSSSYAFMQSDAGQPFVSYDPCRPIHYVMRPSNAPAGSDRIVAEAVSAVSRATGFIFINDGATDEAPSAKRPVYQPDRYGDRWAPVLIAWQTQAEEPRFILSELQESRTTLGLGGSNSATEPGKGIVYVTGQVKLNAAALGAMSRRPGGDEAVTAVVKHELAHVVGLAHVPDPTQLMATTMSESVHNFAAGDLTGLARLGSGPCRPGL